MKKLLVLAIGALVWVGSASAQPVIRAENGVVNANSYAPDIARGSWFDVFGTGMGPAIISVYTSGLPFPTELSGTRVTFTPAAGGTAVEARLWYTSAPQLAALLPSATAAGDYDVRVIYNGQVSAARRVKVVERNFGFATQAQTGAGPAQATYGGADLNRFTTGTVGTWAVRPAKAGDTVVLWGTGLGPDLSSDLTGATSGDQAAAAQVRVVVGGTEIAPLYAGRSNNSPGLDQINFTLPSGVATGCTVSLQVRAGGRTSNLGSLAIASAGQQSCTHPSLTAAQLTKLDQGGTLTYGDFTLSGVGVKMTIPGYGSIDTRSETVGGSFGRYRIDQIADASFSVTVSGECVVARRKGGLNDLTTGTAQAGLDAGSALSLTLPGGRVVSVPRDSKTNAYSASLGGTPNPLGPAPPAVIVAGTYGLAGPGGNDVRAFTASISAPGGFLWSNQDGISEVDRSRSLPIAWSGAQSGSVSIMGLAGQRAGGTEQDPIYDVAVFACLAPASAGQYTVATSVLQQLPAAAFDTGAGVGMLIVMTQPEANAGKFDAQLTAGGAVDGARFTYGIGSSKILNYK
ncbi:MAG: hypothetical protein NT090_17145 [Acidobacteria bacterium]|nr:hypothetical protein [Acidobacteriota bacterium]